MEEKEDKNQKYKDFKEREAKILEKLFPLNTYNICFEHEFNIEFRRFYRLFFREEGKIKYMEKEYKNF